MDPIIALPIVVSCVALLVIATKVRKNTERNQERMVEEARKRAAQRAIERQFADTEPKSDPWAGRLDLTALSIDEVDDRHDGRGSLSTDQKRIVNVILEGVDVSYIDNVDRSGSVFSKDNQVEYVDPWANTVR